MGRICRPIRFKNDGLETSQNSKKVIAKKSASNLPINSCRFFSPTKQKLIKVHGSLQILEKTDIDISVDSITLFFSLSVSSFLTDDYYVRSIAFSFFLFCVSDIIPSFSALNYASWFFPDIPRW